MISNKKRNVYVATEGELLKQSYYLRLWMSVKSIQISRRSWLDELADTFRDFEGQILKPDGQPFIIPCIDETFGDDPDARWVGIYLRTDKTGEKPKSVSRKLARLQLLDLYFRIKYPLIARHFGI